MNALRNRIFIISVLLFLLHQFLQKCLELNVPLIHAHLDDILCMPVVLTLILAVFRKYILIDPGYCFSAGQITWAVIYFSFMFELVLPFFSAQQVSDPLDVVAYSAGAFVFYKWINNASDIYQPL